MAVGEYDNFEGPTQDYTYYALTLEKNGLYGTYAGFSQDADGEYLQFGYNGTVADIDFGVALILANDSSKRVRLEGHADERGSREYNIGLGERRSQSVRRLLMIQGASASQISTVSFGEERPVAFGSDEDSWAQNRRVEIKYTN